MVKKPRTVNTNMLNITVQHVKPAYNLHQAFSTTFTGAPVANRKGARCATISVARFLVWGWARPPNVHTEGKKQRLTSCNTLCAS